MPHHKNFTLEKIQKGINENASLLSVLCDAWKLLIEIHLQPHVFTCYREQNILFTTFSNIIMNRHFFPHNGCVFYEYFKVALHYDMMITP